MHSATQATEEIFVRNVTPNKDAFMEMIAFTAIMEELDHFDYFSEEDKKRVKCILQKVANLLQARISEKYY